jgi:hypothetical protein
MYKKDRRWIEDYLRGRSVTSHDQNGRLHQWPNLEAKSLGVFNI